MRSLFLLVLLSGCVIPRSVRVLTEGDGMWTVSSFSYATETFEAEATGGWMHFVSDKKEADNLEDRDHGHGEALIWEPVSVDGEWTLVPMAETFWFQVHDSDGSLAFVWASDRYHDLFVDSLSDTHVEMTSGIGGSWDDGEAVRTYVLDKP
jgi:hypothetical protein